MDGPGDGPSHRDPLALDLRKVARLEIFAVAQADRLEHSIRLGATAFRPRQPFKFSAYLVRFPRPLATGTD